MDLCDVFTHIHQGCFTGVGAVMCLPNNSEVPTLKYMGEIDQGWVY